MSGYICGNILLNGKEPENFDEVFDRTVINQYKLDRFDYSVAGNAQFACGIIHVTKEDEFETLPFYDAEAGLFITADVILDNRGDLIKDLALNSSGKVITDGFIVLEAYKKWGYDTPKHLLGDFAFAIWDEKKQELFITRDHTGTRSLYYTKDENSIRFSTTLNPLIGKLEDKQALLCEEWLAMFFSLPDGMTEYDSQVTMFNNIFQCPIANALVVKKDVISVTSYWNPKDLINCNRDKLTKDEWLSLFKSIYTEAVKCRIRSEEYVGVFLSGGLDSTSVAAVASNELKKIDKELFSFTSIPMYEVTGYNEKYFTVNEKMDVEKFASFFSNIRLNFIECENLSILSSIDELIKITEAPFQAIENLTWINEIYKKAVIHGCKVMLKGQFGNVTISRGEFLVHIQTLKKHHRYLEILREIDAGAKLHNMPKKVIIRQIISIWTPEMLKTIKRKISNKKKGVYNSYLGFVNQDLIKKYNIIEKLKVKKLYERNFEKPDFNKESAQMLNEIAMTLVGAYDTKFGLHYGLITRDPTKDIRVIEYCLKAPYELFVEKGVERKLIRDAMVNIVPDEIRMNHSRRGVQGVDWDKRVVLHRSEFFRQIESLNKDQIIFRFLEKDKVERLLGYGSKLFDFERIEDLKQVIYWTILHKAFERENLNE